MNYYWILAIFGGGLLFKQLKLPPLVGFLAAGFILNAAGMEQLPFLEQVSDLGVTLLLFTIGLKINLKDLLKPEIVLAAGAQTIGVIFAGLLFLKLMMIVVLEEFAALNWEQTLYLSLALSFSSTVCAVKILEDKNELRTRHGQVVMNLLVLQDFIAVLFLSLATDKVPSPFAAALLFLPLMRPLFAKLLQKAEHGEMLPLAGIFLALTGGELFHLLDVKADLGALIFGMLLSKDKKATELAKSLLSLKDIFLIAFFLSVGFKALPTAHSFYFALLFIVFLLFKALIFFAVLVIIRLRVRSAFLATLALANYSEFGLIVVIVCEKQGWIGAEWVVIIAIAVALSFLLTSILNDKSHAIYNLLSPYIHRFERSECLDEDVFYQAEGAEVLVIGMGRVGRGVYDTMKRHSQWITWGVDANKSQIETLREKGYLVTVGDAEDIDFWNKVNFEKIRLIMLALPAHEDMKEVLRQLKHSNYQGKVAGIAKHEDQRQELLDLGVDVAFNFYAEAGAGFAEASLNLLHKT